MICNKAEIDNKEISILGNSSHFEWRAALSDTLLKRDHPRTIPAKFALIWFCGFRGENLNMIFYQNMPNLHNRNKSAERKISYIQTCFIFIFILKTTGTFTPVHSAGYLILHNELRSTQEVARQNIQVSFYIRCTRL